MKKILIIILLLGSVSAWGQIYNNPFLAFNAGNYDTVKSLRIGSNYSLGSNALNTPFYNSIFNNATFIGDNIKNAPLPYLKNNNDFGGYFQNYIFYKWPAKIKDVDFYINLSSRIQYSSQFSGDAYKLILFGNNQFSGNTANVSGFNFSNYAYQSLQFGFLKGKRSHFSSALLYGGGISIVSGAGYGSLSIPNGSLYTSPTGDSLSVNARVGSKSVNAQDLITDVNGMGLSLNGFVSYLFARSSNLTFQVEDLGAINWFKNTSQFSFNKQISYTGEKVSIINGKVSLSKYYLTLDSIATQNGYSSSGGSFTTMLPFQLRLLYTKYVDERWILNTGAEYIHDNMKIPEISFWAERGFMKRYVEPLTYVFSIRCGLTAFGYSNYGIIAGLEFNILRKIKLNIGTEHLEGLSSIPQAHGESYYASLKWAIW